jgi:ubiquinone/menaquinone biosynthesis C-methylase UbiE/CheY-like chemotaxis protein
MQQSKAMQRVVVVDDEEDDLSKLESSLRRAFDVQAFTDPREALTYCHRNGLPEVLVVDERMPQLSGLELFKALNHRFGDHPQVVRILLTGFSEIQDTIDSTHVGHIDHYCSKSLRPDELLGTVRRLLSLKRPERRSAARIPVPEREAIRMTDGDGAVHRVGDLGAGGLFLFTHRVHEHGASIPLEIQLSGGVSLRFSGRIAHVDRERDGVGIAFCDREPRLIEALEQLVRNHYRAHDHATLATRFPNLKLHELVLFTEPDTIEQMLSTFANTNTVTVVPGYNQRRVPARLTRVDAASGSLALAFAEQIEIPHVGEPVLISMTDNHRTFGSETVLFRVDSEGREALAMWPRAVFHADRRRCERIPALEKHCLELEISLHHPKATVRGKVLDRSDDGLSIFVPGEPGLVFPGSPLPMVRLFDGDQPQWSGPAEIRHLSPREVAGERGFVAGVQLGLGRAPAQRRPSNVAVQVYRPEAEAAPRLPDVGAHHVVRYPDAEGREIVGLLNLVPALRPSDEVPVVILPPGLGKTKEVLVGLALTLECTFRAVGKPIAILRFDGVRRRGESYHDPDCEAPERQSLRMTLRQGQSDLDASLQFVTDNPRFRPGPIFLVTFSLSTLEGRLFMRDGRYRHLIDRWIVCMGFPELRRVVARISANFDIVEASKLGMRLGVTEFLGVPIDADRFFSEALNDGLDDFPRARQDFSAVEVPISWLLGEHDHWIDRAWVEEVLNVQSRGPREVTMAPLGHTARTSKEALALFAMVGEILCRHLGVQAPVTIPDEQLLSRIRGRERDRLPSPARSDLASYWEQYLLGDRDDEGFDAFTYSEDYQAFLRLHAELLDLRAEHRVLEVGAGTGNLLLAVKEAQLTLPQAWTLTDLVPAALTKAQRKHEGLFPPTLERSYRGLDVELSPYRIVQNFLSGEYFALSELHGRIAGARLDSLEKLQQALDSELFRLLRGARLGEAEQAVLKQRFEWDVYETLVDLNTAVRVVRREAQAGYRRLNLPMTADTRMDLPFDDGSFDRIVASLVLPYVQNPTETLRELRRILRPGGRIVFSTMNPDADTSGIFVRMIERLEALPKEQLKGELEDALRSARRLLNQGAHLADLEEQGLFEFFTDKQLRQMCSEAGFGAIRLVPGFGSPAQATVVVTERD